MTTPNREGDTPHSAEGEEKLLEFRKLLEDAHINIYEEGVPLFKWLRKTLTTERAKAREEGERVGAERELTRKHKNIDRILTQFKEEAIALEHEKLRDKFDWVLSHYSADRPIPPAVIRKALDEALRTPAGEGEKN